MKMNFPRRTQTLTHTHIGRHALIAHKASFRGRPLMLNIILAYVWIIMATTVIALNAWECGFCVDFAVCIVCATPQSAAFTLCGKCDINFIFFVYGYSTRATESRPHSLLGNAMAANGIGRAVKPWEQTGKYLLLFLYYISTYINLNSEDFDLKLDNIVHTICGINAAKLISLFRRRHQHRVHGKWSFPHELTEDFEGAKKKQKLCFARNTNIWPTSPETSQYFPRDANVYMKIDNRMEGGKVKFTLHIKTVISEAQASCFSIAAWNVECC